LDYFPRSTRSIDRKQRRGGLRSDTHKDAPHTHIHKRQKNIYKYYNGKSTSQRQLIFLLSFCRIKMKGGKCFFENSKNILNNKVVCFDVFHFFFSKGFLPKYGVWSRPEYLSIRSIENTKGTRKHEIHSRKSGRVEIKKSFTSY
jgi:hypothetical protein